MNSFLKKLFELKLVFSITCNEKSFAEHTPKEQISPSSQVFLGSTLAGREMLAGVLVGGISQV